MVAAITLLAVSGCERSPESARADVSRQSDTHKRHYSVLSQETLERETVFEVAVPGAPRVERDVLLDIAQSLHVERGERDRTLVIFRDPRQVPSRPLSLDERYAHAFAVAILEPARGVRELRFGVFN
jgi:hypothetical protein